MLAQQEQEFKGIMKEYNFEDQFEKVDPDMEDLHKELKKQGILFKSLSNIFRKTCKLRRKR